MIYSLTSFWSMLIDVLLFWKKKFKIWLSYRSPVDVWFGVLRDAQSYEEWEEATLQLDILTGRDIWRQNPISKHYDYRLIYERLQSIITAREDGDFLQLINLLRSGLVRNLGNISTPRIFNCAFSGTKQLIEDYVTQVTLAIADVTKLPTSPGLDDNGNRTSFRFSSQAKLDLLHDTRHAFGRSALILQGGAIFGLCHLGVVKALFAQGLLPRIISGTATGALIAVLVGTHTEDELPRLLNGESIDLTAFGSKKSELGSESEEKNYFATWWTRMNRSLRCFLREGYFLDVGVLERCMRDNVGDITFEEAYNRTRRVLNITVATTGRGGAPNLLNYLTAPNVLIWSAAIASNMSSHSIYGSSSPTLKCKDASGEIVPWSIATDTTFRPWTHTSYTDRESPLARIAELFNVNHFIVSQARPYLVPFLQSDMHGPLPLIQRWGRASLMGSLLRLIGMELDHRAHQLGTLGLLPPSIKRFLVNEQIPGTAVTLVPEISARDFIYLLETPTRANLNYWILRGEKSVWPAIGALKVRCTIETELDRGYQLIRRRKSAGLSAEIARRNSILENNAKKERRRERVRADSLHGKW